MAENPPDAPKQPPSAGEAPQGDVIIVGPRAQIHIDQGGEKKEADEEKGDEKKDGDPKGEQQKPDAGELARLAELAGPGRLRAVISQTFRPSFMAGLSSFGVPPAGPLCHPSRRPFVVQPATYAILQLLNHLVGLI